MLAADVIGLDPWLAALAVVIVLVGAALQASIGIGLGLLAAPTLAVIDPAFIPGAITVCVVPLVVGMTVREIEHVDRSIFRAVLGRLAGVVIGAWVAGTTGPRTIAIVVGLSVLLAVIASVTKLHFSPTRRNLMIAGAAAGFSGTVAGIGGPPMALTYQHSDPRVLRGSLAAFNTIGSMFTIPSLMIAGVIGWREFQLALMLIPGVLVGLWIGRFTIARLRPERVRPFVLAACAGSAILLLVSELT